MATTLQNLRDTFYDILREEQDTSAYPLDMVDLLLNSAQQRICLGRVINPLTKEQAWKGTLPFINSDQFYSTVASTTTTSALTVWATTIEVNTASDFASSGTLYLDGNIITYTGKTATSFTGVSGVLFAHSTATNVYQVFDLPSDYASPINIVYNHRYKLESQLYDDVFESLKSHKGADYRRNSVRWPFSEPYTRKPFYTIKDATYLILFNVSVNDYSLQLRYEKLPATMTAGTDNATISNDIYAKTTIPYLAVGEMLYNRGEEARAGELLNFAIGQVREMYAHYNNSMQEKLSGKQYRMAKSRLNI